MNTPPSISTAHLRLKRPVRQAAAICAGATPASREPGARGEKATNRSGAGAEVASSVPEATRDQLANQVRQVLSHLETEVNSIRASHEKLRGQMQQQAIELAVALTSKVLCQQIQESSFPLSEMVDQLLGEADVQQPATVYVHPSDLKMIRIQKANAVADENAKDKIQKDLKWLADPGLPRGSARIDGVNQAVFFSAAFQLEELHRALKEVVSDHSH